MQSINYLSAANRLRRGTAGPSTASTLSPARLLRATPPHSLRTPTLPWPPRRPRFLRGALSGATERRKRLLRAADIVDSLTPEFIATGIAETGATAGWYGFNVMLAANMLREAASMTTQITGEVIPSDVPGSVALAVRRPCGVVLGIAPWNAPVILGMRAIAMPLACGNTVVLKGSELCPGVHRLIGTALQQG